MKQFKKVLSLLLVLCMTAALMTGCGNKGGNEGGDPTPTQSADQGGEAVNTDPLWKTLDSNISGELSVMCWSGDSVYYENIGAMNLAPEDITSQNVAAVYAMAKEFNKLYPNVKINLFAKSGDPDSNDTSWEQEMENFKAQHGKYPDVWASTNLIGDVQKGLVADLSVFSDDPLYQSFNQSIMSMMNYYGMQAGLPQFIQPWGVFINTELAEQNNIDVPDPDWTLDDYTDFIAQGNKTTFWGAMDIPLSWINTGTKDINYSLANYDGSGTYVNLESDAVKDLLSMIPEWADNTIWPQNDIGGVPTEIMDDGWWWSYHFFVQGYCLTNDGDPWMMGDAANPEITDSTCNFEFDIYPRPATDYVGNTVGVVLDPVAVHNYAMDDGNPVLSASEEESLKLAYAFATFWAGSTEAMQARADQQWNSGGALKTALNDSLPLVTGDEFDKQMEIWYNVPIHQAYKTKEGWNKCVELWEAGQTWDISDKAYPCKVFVDGVSKLCLDEWTYYYSDAHMTAKRASDGWLDEIKSKLSEWNRLANERFAEAETALKAALTDFYGYTEADFK